MSARTGSVTFARPFLAVMLAGALLRTWHVLAQRRVLPFLDQPILDAALYHRWATALAGGGGASPEPYYHAPGYPFLLTAVYGIFGPHPLAAVIVQSLLGLGTLALTMLLGRRWFGSGVGLLAGVLLLGVGPLYFFEAKLLGTTVAVFLGVLVLWLLDRGLVPGPVRGARGWTVILLAGAAAGVLGLVRANLLLFPAFVLLGLAGHLFRKGSGRWAPLVFLIAMLVPILPVLVHNGTHGAWSIATNGGFNFYAGNVRGASGVYVDLPGISGAIQNQEAEADALVAADLGRELPPGEESRYWFRRGLREIADAPYPWVRLVIQKAWLLMNRQEETVNASYAVERRRIGLLRFAAVPFNLLALLGTLGFLLARSRPDARRFRPAAGLLLAVAVSALGFFVMSRLRLPAAPVLAIFTAYTLSYIRSRVRAGARLRLIPGVMLLLVFLVASWRSPLGEARNPRWEAQLFTEAGRGLLESGKLDRAREAFRTAESLDPSAPQPFQGEADAAARRGDIDGAIEALVRAAVIAPEDAGIQSNLGILYFAAGRYDDCLRSMARASELQPGAGAPYLYRGRVLELRGDPGAADAYRQALDRDPTLRGAYEGLVRRLRGTGQDEEARRWIEAARNRGILLPDSLRTP